MHDTEQDNKSASLCGTEDQCYRTSKTLGCSGLKLLDKGLLSKGGAEGGVCQEKLFVPRYTSDPETELYLIQVGKETCLEYTIIRVWKR